MVGPASLRRLVARGAALAALAAVLAAPPAPAGERPSGPRGWDGRTPTVHEWGTFTAVSGSDGVVLEGLSHEERDLPDFVHDLRDRRGLTGVSPKMETPVLYVYTPVAQRLRVHVDFPRGTVTHWYPSASRVNRSGFQVHGREAAPAPPMTDRHRDGCITWGRRNDLEVLAPGAAAPVPPVAADDPWRFAREVDANLLRICRWQEDRIVEEHERFLFYRGLGAFDLPLGLRLRSERVADDRATLRLGLAPRASAGPLRHLFVVVVRDGRAGHAHLAHVPADTTLALEIPLRPVAQATRDLAGRVAAALEEDGLYEREARAMVNTWQAGWFAGEGIRALYLLPRAFVDRELPLTLGAPAPEAGPAWDLVRTFVARVELLSPEQERRLVATVADLAHPDPARRARAEAERAGWGRFAEPWLARVRALTGEEEFAAEAERAPSGPER